MTTKHPTLCEALAHVVGEPVMSVDFVEDYVQLRWQGWFLIAYTLPKIKQGNSEHASESPEYRDMLYSLEGRVLCSADVVPGMKVSLHFPESLIVDVPLTDADYVGPEAMQFGGVDGPLWVI